MGEKSIKTHFDRNVIFTFLAVFLLGTGLLSFKINKNVDCTAADFDIISSSYTTEDLIEFKSIDTSGFEWEWDFGDASEGDYRSNVVHQFKEPGLYKVVLEMNSNCVVTKEVTILAKKKVINPELVPDINAPRSIRVGELVEFKNTSGFAKSWEWSFGETAIVDSRDQNPKYIFKTPGQKTILLITNEDSQHASRHKITVLPEKVIERTRVTRTVAEDHIEVVLKTQIPDAPPERVLEDVPDVPPEEEKPEIEKIEISKPSFIQLLNGYALRRVNESKIKKYFCTHNIPVFNSTGKRFDTGSFFREIRDKKVEIKDVRMYKNKTTGCLQSFTIDMKIKKGLFWKDF